MTSLSLYLSSLDNTTQTLIDSGWEKCVNHPRKPWHILSMEEKRRDLLSDLPDDILHHIISFLQVKDILRLKSLSRRFLKTLSITSIPSFCFSDYSSYSHNSCSCTHVSDFMINTVLPNRLNTLGIDRISFSSLCNKEEHADLHQQWIFQLFESFHVNELSLVYELPPICTSLPNFQSLKVLRLSMNDEGFLEDLPKIKLASLETLLMKSFGADDSLDEWISQSFPSLKHLFLQKITNWAYKQDFTIQSSSLEDLAILNCSWFKRVRLITENLRSLDCFIHFDDDPEHETKFVLENCAPNLQSLTWVGGADPKNYRLDHDEETLQNLQVTTMRRSLIMKESDENVLTQLFKAIPLARELHIDTEVLKHWLRILRTPMGMLEDYDGETLTVLENLRSLEIHVREYINGDNYITFLERSNLETLTLVNYPNNESDSNPYLKESVRGKFKKALRNCRKHELRRTKGLKKVKLIMSHFCRDNMVVVIGWLMKSCTDLEKVMLYYPSCYHKFMMREGLQYLMSFERASPTPPSFHFFPDQN